MHRLCLCVLGFFIPSVLGADRSNGNTEQEASSRLWTGLLINGRQYPSIEEARSMTLYQLLQTRPSKLCGLERSNFEHLFAMHNDVSMLNPHLIPNEEEFIQKWVDLWSATETGPKGKRLHHAIVSHLSKTLSLSEKLLKEIIRRHTLAMGLAGSLRSRQKRLDAVDPIDVAKRQEYLQRQARYSKERRKGMRGKEYGAALFKIMLNQNGISPLLPAIELEEATRHLRDTLGGVQQTTLHLRQFLTCRNAKEEGIKIATQSRRAHNYALLRQKMNEKQKLLDHIRRPRRYKAKISSQIQDGDLESSRSSDALSLSAKLTRQSVWWTS